MSKLPDLGAAFDPAVLSLVEQILTVARPDLWTESEVADARVKLEQQYGSVPSLEDVATRFGEDVTVETARKVLQKRSARVQAVVCATKIAYQDRWSQDEVDEAKQWLTEGFGREVSLDELAGVLGEDVTVAIAKNCIRERSAAIADFMERMGEGSNCHLCNNARQSTDPHYEFGLARVVSKKKDWLGFVGSLAVNALTVPLGVVVTPRGVGSTTTANIMRCRLVLCDACARTHRNWIGNYKLGEAQCSKHPSWKRLTSDGYSTFLSADQLAGYKPV